MTSQRNNTSNDTSYFDNENGSNGTINQKHNYQKLSQQSLIVNCHECHQFLGLDCYCNLLCSHHVQKYQYRLRFYYCIPKIWQYFLGCSKNDVLTNVNDNSVVMVTEGHTMSAVIIKDENSGGKVLCISMDNMAQMVVNHDKYGNVNLVWPLMETQS